MDAMLAWANTRTAAPKSELGKALTYLKNQWQTLTVFLEDGRIELSNNRAERSIKPFAISRKNFLFANTPGGAQTSAAVQSHRDVEGERPGPVQVPYVGTDRSEPQTGCGAGTVEVFDHKIVVHP